MQEWVAKRDALLKAASDDLVAIYAKMQPENAAVQLSAMDDQMAAAILGKLKPSAAGAILDEMEAERASKLASLPLGRERRREKILMRLMLPPMWLAIALSVSGCWNSASEFMREPFFSPVGAGLAPEETAGIQSANALAAPQPPSTGRRRHLYSQPRIAHVGDIVRVHHLDQRQGDARQRLRPLADEQRRGRHRLRLQQRIVVVLGQPALQGSWRPSTQSSTQGQGNIDRSEQIQVSVAAIVTRVLSNGNLVISGSQEVRVNYEMRQLTVAGIVNPLDISLNNTVAYDRIAEARIAYGGRGRSNDFQQPPWGQQVYDALRPF